MRYEVLGQVASTRAGAVWKARDTRLDRLVALKQIPKANASWSDEGIKQYKTSDISVAVAIPNGLITPIETLHDDGPITPGIKRAFRRDHRSACHPDLRCACRLHRPPCPARCRCCRY